MKLDRLIGILAVLLQKDQVTAPELAKRFEVSRRTISRDIEALCQAGIPLVTAQGFGGGISIMEGYRMDRTVLSRSDMQAILAGLKSLDSISGTSRYAQLMEKLSPGASGLVAGDPHILINLASWNRASLTPKIELVHGAILSGRRISFAYSGPGGETRRQVEPYDLIFQWSSWYLWGWCLLRGDFRLFKLNRMTGLATEGPFEKRPARLPDLSTDQVFPQTYQVKARIRSKCRWRLVEEYGPDSFTKEPDGSLLFTGGFSDRDSIVGWIASFGADAELLEPEEFRKDVWEFAQGILKNYR